MAQVVDRIRDVQEVLPELTGDILVSRIVLCKLQCDRHQVQAIHAHPAGAVGLLDVASSRQRSASVKDSDVIKAEEPALKHISAVGIFAIDPPVEVEQQLVENALEKLHVSDAFALLIDFVNPP